MNPNPQFQPHRAQPQSAASPPKGECRLCSRSRDSGAMFCPYCGRTLVEPFDASAKTPAGQDCVVPLVRPTAEMPQVIPPQASSAVTEAGPGFREVLASTGIDLCRHCEWELPDNARFCPGCATPLNPTADAKFWIHRIRADGLPTSVPVSGEQFTIGQAEDCDLQLKKDGFVSRRHARLRRENDLLFLEDLGSSNGTLLRIRRPIVVEAGDEIVIGTSVLRVEQRNS